MAESASQCLDLPITAPTPSPFSRFIVFEGVSDNVSAACECADRSRVYWFETIAYGHPHKVDGSTRYTLIYSFRRLPTGAFDQMAALVAIRPPDPSKERTLASWLQRRLGGNSVWKSNWPVWFMDWDHPAYKGKNLLQSVEAILDTAEPPSMVVASNDPTEEILAARQVTPQEMEEVKDWFAFLGLQR